MTAPARRETDATAQLHKQDIGLTSEKIPQRKAAYTRLWDKSRKNPAPIPVHKQALGLPSEKTPYEGLRTFSITKGCSAYFTAVLLYTPADSSIQQ